MNINNKKLLTIIINNVKKLRGFVDIIDRSGEEFTPSWSDIDLSLIFKRIDYKLLKKLRNYFLKWESYGKKLDIFIITPEDNPTLPFHFHGGYQLSYLQDLKKAESLFKKYPLQNACRFETRLLAIDCYRTMALKIQEIRQTVLTGKIRFRSKLLSAKASETMHILKKTKTIIKMASQIIDYTNNEIPSEYIKFTEFYNRVRTKWNSIKNNSKILSSIEAKSINIAEKTFKIISKKYLGLFSKLKL